MFCHHPVRKLDKYWLDIILKRLYPVFYNLSCNDTSVTLPLARPWMSTSGARMSGGIYRQSQRLDSMIFEISSILNDSVIL